MFPFTDILSVLPSSDKGVASAPIVGESAPADPKGRISFPLEPKRPALLVFSRHCGCPFAERDVHTLVDAVLADPDRFKSGADSTPASFIIVTHNTLDASREWFAKVLHAAYEASAVSPKPASDVLGPHFSLFPDPSRALAKAFGVGNLSTWGALFGGETFSAVGSLKEKGIVNLTTGGGSDRWATHGAVAVDAEGKVRWWWKAETASAEGDFIEALKALEI